MRDKKVVLYVLALFLIIFITIGCTCIFIKNK